MPKNSLSLLSLFGLGFLSAAAPAVAEPAVDLSIGYKADVTGLADGGDRGVRYLDNLDLIGDVDLDKAVGWQGATFHAHGLVNLGGKPNDLAGTLQGVDNIEVPSHRARLFEAVLEQKLGEHVSALIGLYDLNSEFYQNDSAGLLIAPAFGIGSELASTGPNGPSIFPSSALAARLRYQSDSIYVQTALLNAKAGTIGDDQGVNLFGRDGLLSITEAGWTGDGKSKLAVGYWRYTKKQPAIIPPDLTTALPFSRSQGAYVLAERELAAGSDHSPKITAFARGGLSDGRTTPFRSGWQAGLLVERPFALRPDSSFSIGVNQAYLSGRYRRAAAMLGTPMKHAESAVEITYSDTLIGPVRIQPDAQYVFNAGGDAGRKALILGVRFEIGFDLIKSGKD